jgi:hypothetical protein
MSMDGRLERAWLSRQRREPASAIGPLLSGWWQQQASREARQMGPARRAWAEVVPPELGGAAEVMSLRAGQLRVRVESAVERYVIEVVLHDELVRSMNNLMGRVAVRRIRCELGPAEPRGRA